MVKRYIKMYMYTIDELLTYSKFPIIRPPMVLVESRLNSEQVS